jgi:hypothetical protein
LIATVSFTGGLPRQVVFIGGGKVVTMSIYTKEELIKHCLWCVRECPCTDAEITVHWFLFGKPWLHTIGAEYRDQSPYLQKDECN